MALDQTHWYSHIGSNHSAHTLISFRMWSKLLCLIVMKWTGTSWWKLAMRNAMLPDYQTVVKLLVIPTETQIMLQTSQSSQLSNSISQLLKSVHIQSMDWSTLVLIQNNNRHSQLSKKSLQCHCSICHFLSYASWFPSLLSNPNPYKNHENYMSCPPLQPYPIVLLCTCAQTLRAMCNEISSLNLLHSTTQSIQNQQNAQTFSLKNTL